MNVELDRAGEGPGTVLNVNDHLQQRDVVSRMLQQAGYRVIEAGTGQEAVDRSHAEHPDVVVLDIHLPDINGMEVCRQLKEDGVPGGPLVVHTSATVAGTDVRVRGLDVGGDAFLAQPFTAQELVATVRALMRRRRVEADQRRRTEALAEADRRKDDFLSILGHELRNPLNALAMSQAIIERAPPQTPEEQHARAVARRQTAHLTRLVNDLLEVSRVTRGKIPLTRGPLDLVELLEDTVAAARTTMLEPRSQTLRVSVPDAVVPVDGDRVRLSQVFSNLLENASKYSPPGTAIDLELDVAPREGQAQAQAVVTVSDRGQGIAREQLDHVFSLFYQAQPTEARIGTGLGIGLTLVRSLVELHGGSVAARSAGLGRGSEFEVRLPMRPEAQLPGPSGGRTVQTRRRATRQAKTVLVIEDHADARELLRSLCESWGFTVETAANGLDGVALALAVAPEVCLVDIGLPGIDGYEVARRLRADERTAGLPLVALTGYGLPLQRERAAAAGFDVHLVKPVEPDLLRRLLDDPRAFLAAVRRHRGSEAAPSSSAPPEAPPTAAAS